MPRNDTPIYQICEDLGIFSPTAQESLRDHCLQFLKRKLQQSDQELTLPQATDIDIRDAAQAFLGEGNGTSHFSPPFEGNYRWKRESDQPEILAKIVSIMETQRTNATGKLHKQFKGDNCPGCFLYHRSDMITVENGDHARRDKTSRSDLGDSEDYNDKLYQEIGNPQGHRRAAVQHESATPNEDPLQTRHVRGQGDELSPRPAKRRRVQEVDSSVSPRCTSSKSTPAASMPPPSLRTSAGVSESSLHAITPERSATREHGVKARSFSTRTTITYNNKLWTFDSLDQMVEALQAVLQNQDRELNERLELEKQRDMLAYFDLGAQYQREIIIPVEKQLQQHGGRYI
ncbi:hypothetical protein H2200_003171 [Cladophialophora chaetospira]|uniref:Uncharacterized protein n=1 Tax=Cladophialophora chaetospira TaxID=386627 RepID=A0AA38XGX6_9EURO|nr:hypothetical protein H2200_003171 [Cladophialophora chaetospira]